MTYKDFAMWLQGILEMSPEGLTAKQVAYVLSKIGTLTFPVTASDMSDPRARC